MEKRPASFIRGLKLRTFSEKTIYLISPWSQLLIKPSVMIFTDSATTGLRSAKITVLTGKSLNKKKG